ncbi:type II 3-dehydroquinate dehydratase [Ancylomarina sp. DW003]|nr:type II 3-dehydroquinate dehydratase [Ancylomarina sp. DW003]MDE5422591.1 type II 3-dehydroquinate dehydratase [Ancylomarina sp. DW003]
MNILILNGPNLNLLGTREKTIYGAESFDHYFEELKLLFPSFALDYFQSNIEGEIINCLHEARFKYDGIVMNAAAYTHTSVAIRDAIAAINLPVIEVHISNVHKREAFRHVSLISASCIGVIAGFGLDSYRLGIEALIKIKTDE